MFIVGGVECHTIRVTWRHGLSDQGPTSGSRERQEPMSFKCSFAGAADQVEFTPDVVIELFFNLWVVQPGVAGAGGPRLDLRPGFHALCTRDREI
jgi:hypothetical protein